MQPAVQPVPETAKPPHHVEVSPSPAPGDRRPPDAKAVEKRIEEVLAEIQKEQTVQAEQQLIQEITGLIVEETMTKIGYEFYECFFLRWEPPDVRVEAYNVLISEKATPMWGSVVEVKIGDTVVFGRMLKPRSEEIEEAVQEAIAAARQYLESFEQRQLQTPDLSTSGV